MSFQRLGMGIVAQMGLGGGGVLGAIGAAIKAADKFAMSQRQIANIFLSNNMFQGAGAFENSMAAASDAMQSMKKAAREFSLPVGELAQFSKLVGAALINKGLDNASLTKSIDLSRFFLKSAPTLGIDPTLAQGQLLDAVMGRANMGDTFFQRLMNETAAMKPFGGTAGAKGFNALDPAKRLDVLTKALKQFGDNAKILEGNALSLSAQIQRLKDNFASFASFLVPIGKALGDPIREALHGINVFLETQGEGVSRNFAKIFRRMFRSTETFLTNILQVRALKQDVQGTSNIIGTGAIVMAIGHALKWVGLTARLAHPAVGAVAVGMTTLFEVFKRMPNDPLTKFTAGFWGSVTAITAGTAVFLKFRAVLAPLFGIVAKSLGIFAVVLGLLQAVSRGAAKAMIFNSKFLIDNAEMISRWMARLQRALELIVLPITIVIDTLSDLFAWMFSMGNADKTAIKAVMGIIEVLDFLGEAMLDFLGIISGVASVIGELVVMLSTWDFSDFATRISDVFTNELNSFRNRWDPINANEGDGETPVSQRITNIDKVEINNQFKENLEPDRIAFAISDQIQKAALNPTRALGNSLRGAQMTR